MAQPHHEESRSTLQMAQKPVVRRDSEYQHINILVIGGTGAGKSTWINAVANYLKFGSLKEAVQAGGEFPIPCQITHPQTREKFSISSEHGITKVQGDDDVGKSVTKYPNEYVLECEDTALKVHMIDTPGLMDTEDTPDHSVDKQHVNNTLRLLSSYKEIHAICIALQSTVNRLSAALKYTLTELMKNLDASAVNNVIFIVTYASGVMFQPRNLLELLQTFLIENKLDIPLIENMLDIPLPPTKATVFCFENGTVNYLAECRNNISHNEFETMWCQPNWSMSQKSTNDMINYVRKLTPLSTASINALYNADHTISILSELVLTMALCNYKNVAALERKEREAERLRERITANPLAFATDDLKQLLIRTEWKVVNKSLGYTNVICESDKCKPTRVAADTTADPSRATEYQPQICCCDCKSPFMYFCDRMSFRGNCNVCGCERSEHCMKTTEQQVVRVEIPTKDESVIKKVVDSSVMLKEIDKAISQCRTRVEKYNKETEKMLSTCAKLNSFVKQNALMASSVVDKLSEKLQWFETAGRKTGAELSFLMKVQDDYRRVNEQSRSKRYSTVDVNDLIQQLYGLELKGRELRNAMEVETSARKEVIKKGRKGFARLVHMFN